jgi:hypothetical protein
MLSRVFGAFLRAAIVLLAIAIPSFFLPKMPLTTADFTSVIAMILAILVFFEYAFTAPSFIEFRFCPPYNRMRFFAFAVVLYALSQVQVTTWNASDMSRIFGGLSRFCYAAWDFPFSPIHVIETAFVQNPLDNSSLIGRQAALALTLSLVGFVLFCARTLMFTLPLRDQKFNIWKNLPTFSAKHIENPAPRLRNLAVLCVVLGVLLPFFLPFVLTGVSDQLGIDIRHSTRLSMWMIAIWAWVPCALLMRAIAFSAISKQLQKEHASA